MWADGKSWAYFPALSPFPISLESAWLPVICAGDLRTLTHLWGSSERASIGACSIFSVGLTHLVSSCFPTITSLSSFGLSWGSLRVDFRTLNLASLPNIVPLLRCCSPISLHLPSALTRPHIASSWVTYNTKHSIDICRVTQKQRLDNRQSKQNEEVVLQSTEDETNPGSNTELTEAYFVSALPTSKEKELHYERLKCALCLPALFSYAALSVSFYATWLGQRSLQLLIVPFWVHPVFVALTDDCSLDMSTFPKHFVIFFPLASAWDM